MPWPWALVPDCYDFRFGRIDKWPYPTHSWHRQAWILDCLRETVHAVSVFREGRPESFNDHQKKYLRKVMTWLAKTSS